METRVGAFTVWRNRISPVFDTSSTALVVTQHEHNTFDVVSVSLRNLSLLEKILYLTEGNVQSLVCGAISRTGEDAAIEAGMEIFPFCSGDIDCVMSRWLEGTLNPDEFLMPGCRCRKRAEGRFRNRKRSFGRRERMQDVKS